jgi:hypothetical protein
MPVHLAYGHHAAEVAVSVVVLSGFRADSRLLDAFSMWPPQRHSPGDNTRATFTLRADRSGLQKSVTSKVVGSLMDSEIVAPHTAEAH